MTGWAVIVLVFFCIIVFSVFSVTIFEAFRMYRRTWGLVHHVLVGLIEDFDF